ncbi:GSCFA domain-containing protein [Nioella nitratireducens]|uniref:GSCFA domain-containing protein n=1 Tax=Nioella nitratireducens TaxID=1287720 RepID=UPI0008FD5012|nr:GSCFA domain-containing protein [Nioella nitratireducens]
MKSPYSSLPGKSFWRTGVAENSPLHLPGIYTKKWPIELNWEIATAGSCFAQHISRNLKSRGLNVIDVEPAPEGLPESVLRKYGYNLYSARFGNIYTVGQLLQIAREANGCFKPAHLVWKKENRFFDSQRPSVEPDGFETAEELIANRRFHLSRVLQMLKSMDLFIFTLGLTETFEDIGTGTVYPTAPGTVAGEFDPSIFRFKNYNVFEIIKEFESFLETLSSLRDGSLPKIILTVSPVPLTATCSTEHVLSATTYSKSVLRSASGYLSNKYEFIDYFPSYEIITNQAARGVNYSNNLRSVRPESVEVVMKHFFSEHQFAMPGAQNDEVVAETMNPEDRPLLDNEATRSNEDYVKCEEVLLEAFNNAK